MRINFTLLVFLTSLGTFSQVKIQNLYFNSTQDIIRLNFNVLPPNPIYTGIAGINNSSNEPEIAEGIAHVEDEQGNIIIWVNSNGVYDKDGVLMPGSASILADPSSTEIVICPVPNNTDQFYIFYNKKSCSTLLYAIVDMKQRGGLGDVKTKDNSIDPTNTYAEGLEIIKIPCTNEYWLITYQCTTGFKRFRIGASGINTDVLIPYSIENDFQGRGELDYHNGKIGYSINGKNRAYVADFDPKNGTFSNGQTLSFAATNGMYGVEFSPDGTKAYFTDWYNLDFFGDISSDNLFCYDFTTKQIRSWRIAYRKCSEVDVEGLGQIELGRDGKLYIPHVKGCQITVIENPNSASPTFSTIDINSVLSTGVSDHIQSEIFAPLTLTASKTLICEGESVTLTATGNTSTYRWSPAISTSSTIEVSPTTETTYHVYAQNQYGCDDSASVTIKVKNLSSQITMITQPLVCGITSATLKASEGMDLYQWYRDNQILSEQTQASITTTESGIYKVIVNLNECTSESNELIVNIEKSLELRIPNLITPDNDLGKKNETFKVEGAKGTVKVVICNRWGQEVYKNNNYQNDWDGDNLPDGIYYYYVSNLDNCFAIQKGWLHILRGSQE